MISDIARKTTFGSVRRLSPFYIKEQNGKGTFRRVIKKDEKTALNLKTKKMLWLAETVEVWVPRMRSMNKI